MRLRARNMISGAATADTTAVSLSRLMLKFPIGGSTTRIAWGSTTQRSAMSRAT